MSRVQSIERAFAVLGTLANGPIGVTEVADRTDLPKSTAARLLASLAHEGVVEQIPGDTRYRLGPRLATLASGVMPTRSLRDAGAAVARGAGDRCRRGGRPGDPRRRRRPLHRPGRHAEPGLDPRLDRVADPAPCGVVGPGAARVPAADIAAALPRQAAGAVHATDDRRPATPCSNACGRSGATATRGRARSSTRGSARWRRPSRTPTAKWSPPSTSTGRRTGFPSRAPRARSRSWSWRRPPGSRAASVTPGRTRRGSRPRSSGVRRAGSARRTVDWRVHDSASRHRRSIGRDVFSSRKAVASTMSAIVDRRPVGVCDR